MKREKPHIKVVILGNVDSGKTTLVGHLVHKCGVIDKRTFDRFEKQSIERGKHLFKYAYMLDQLERGRERGISINISSWRFETNKNDITLIDCLGRRDFINSMITGILNADCALLLVPASFGEFEASMARSCQIRQQILLASSMGINRMIVVVNKMDTTDPPYSEHRFNEITTKVLLYLKRMSYQSQNVTFIPVSCWHGDNMMEPSDKMPWFTGWNGNNEENNTICRTLLEALDAVVLPQQPVDKPLRLSVQAIYKKEKTKAMLVGRVEAGILKPNMIIQFAPSYLSAQVESIQMQYKVLAEALPGDNVEFIVNGVSKENLRRGFVCSEIENDPAQETSSFTAELTVLCSSDRIRQGYKCVIHCHMAQVACQIVELIVKIDRKSGQAIERNPDFLKSDDFALVKIIPLKPICVEKCIDHSTLGRFIVFNRSQAMAVGIIKHVEKKARSIVTTTDET